MKQIRMAALLAATVLLFSSAAFSAAPSMRDEIVTAVNHGVKIINAKGKAGFDDIKTYRFGGGDGYLLVTDMNGVMLYHPTMPQLIGKDQTTNQDTKGKYFFAEMKSKFLKEGSGWTSYSWLNPKTNTVEMKCTYYRTATMDGKKVVVMGGLYGIPEGECK